MAEAAPNFQAGEKKRQRAFAERASLACCWDRRQAISLLRAVVGGDESSTGSRWVDGGVIDKIAEFLAETHT